MSKVREDNRDWCPLCEKGFTGKTEGQSFRLLAEHMNADHTRLVSDVAMNAAENARQTRYKAIEAEELALLAPLPAGASHIKVYANA